MDYLVDAPPLVLVLCTTLDDAEALQDVDDIIDATPLDPKLLGALIKI